MPEFDEYTAQPEADIYTSIDSAAASGATTSEQIAATSNGPYFGNRAHLAEYPPLQYGERVISQTDPRHEVLAELSLIVKNIGNLRAGLAASIENAILAIESAIEDIFEATRHRALFSAASPYLAQAKNPDTMHQGLTALEKEWIPQVEAHIEEAA